MKLLKNKSRKEFNENKLIVLIVILLILLAVSVTIPTLSQYNNRTSTNTIATWDGNVASSYRSGEGTLEEPYVISDGAELAYFASQLETTNYENKYFILNNDIVLNDGVFIYDKENGIRYIKDGIKNIITPNEDNSVINEFKSIDGFKGNFNGNSHSIYGVYIDESLNEQNGLFTNLEGNVSNLYIENSVIYSGTIIAGVASTATNSNITNVLYDGYVISDEEIDSNTIILDFEDIIKNESSNEISDNIVINDLNYIPGIVTEITLSGTYQSKNSSGILKINDEIINDGDFKINLGTTLKAVIPITYQSDSESSFNLTKLKYEVTYNYSNAAGIVSIAENTTLKNVINKANVSASIYASGIINTISNKGALKNVYNTGTIESNDTSSGLVSNINQNKEDVTIINCYNAGTLISNNSAMIGNIENNIGNVTLENIFNTQDNYGINLIESTNVSIKNSYIISDKSVKTGTSNGKFNNTTLENLKSKTFIQTNLKYEEFTETENIEDNVWIFEYDTLPILYIDTPVANIYVSEHTWNNYRYELNTLKLPNEFVFSIKEADELNTIKEIYYYISNEKEALSKEELNAITNWEKYEEITQINQEGFYIIYAKVIDYKDNITYLNTDLLVLDLTGSNITISTSLTDDMWTTLKTDLNNYYIDREINIDIEAEDSLSGIKKIYYYISDTILSLDELEKLDSWIEYTENISISSKETIIYAKVVDNCDYATYANSDLIILNGYSLNSLLPGMNGSEEEDLYITDKSSVSLNFSYRDNNGYIEGHKHQLVSNVLLPQNTKITLIDKEKNKVYNYITTDSYYGYNDCIDSNCKAIYDFELFSEVGSTLNFQESDYTGTINENFIVIIDFANTKINENIENVSISLKLDNENIKENRNTLISSMKKFNINIENSQAYFTLSTTFDNTINYNENANYIIDFSTKLNYKYLEENKIFDTTFEDKNIGLAIKMVNEKGTIVENKYLKNISFSVGDKKYYPSSDGIVRINLEKGISDITDNLIIQTYSDNSKLESGSYKFIIELYTAYDGIYSNENLTNIEIPIYVGLNNHNSDNSFNVIMNSEDKIITTNSKELDFSFLINDTYDKANIKISLYKKKKLSAYNQEYEIIDLDKYLIDNKLEKYTENIYYALKEVNNKDTLKINLDTSLLGKNGYMFVFELYDDERLINKINKKFIVK